MTLAAEVTTLRPIFVTACIHAQTRGTPMTESHTPIEGSQRAPLPEAATHGRAAGGRCLLGNPHDARGACLGAWRSADDIKAVTDAFTKFGLTVVSTNAATRSVVLSGSAQAMESAFQAVRSAAGSFPICRRTQTGTRRHTCSSSTTAPRATAARARRRHCRGAGLHRRHRREQHHRACRRIQRGRGV